MGETKRRCRWRMKKIMENFSSDAKIKSYNFLFGLNFRVAPALRQFALASGTLPFTVKVGKCEEKLIPHFQRSVELNIKYTSIWIFSPAHKLSLLSFSIYLLFPIVSTLHIHCSHIGCCSTLSIINSQELRKVSITRWSDHKYLRPIAHCLLALLWLRDVDGVPTRTNERALECERSEEWTDERIVAGSGMMWWIITICKLHKS